MYVFDALARSAVDNLFFVTRRAVPTPTICTCSNDTWGLEKEAGITEDSHAPVHSFIIGHSIDKADTFCMVVAFMKAARAGEVYRCAVPRIFLSRSEESVTSVHLRSPSQARCCLCINGGHARGWCRRSRQWRADFHSGRNRRPSSHPVKGPSSSGCVWGSWRARARGGVAVHDKKHNRNS